MKLQLKHIAPYLPHNTMMVRFENSRLINTTTLNPTFLHEQRWDKVWKLALHPLSDLTKEIEVNGEKFVPIDKLYNMSDYSEYIQSIEEDIYEMNTPLRWPHEIVLKLYQWHFDLEGLIESGLAIDINTLNKN